MSSNRNKKKSIHKKNSITIDKTAIRPGESALIKINVGKLPSGTRINIHTHVFNGLKPGPTLLILGGVHGDEINGLEAIRKMLFEDKFENLKIGSIIAIPIVNIYGFINFSRSVPDGKDVNRSFPGSMKGSLASRVARVITMKIIPHVDSIIDLHTGGASRFNHPQIRYTASDQNSFDLAKIFGAPFIIKKPLISKSLRKIAYEKKIPVLVYEGGESLRFDGYSIQLAIDGIMRVMNHLGMSDFQVNPVQKMVHFTKTSWIRAPKSGLFMWTKRSGQHALKDEKIGVINDPHGMSSTAVLANKNGYIIGHNNASVVNQGDALFHISYDYENL